MSVLEVENLSKTYDTLQVLNNVNFSIQAGEIFGYLGPNGAGKTTTLRIILGLVHATSGTVRLFGKDPLNAATRLAIGYLPGELRLYGNMTGSALLHYFARCHSERPPILREQLLKKLDLAPSDLNRKVKFLSQGTRQKLGLIIAMQHDPELLLLDEPTLGLDPLVQQAFRELIVDFAARGKAIFFSSHILSEVETLCNRVAILRTGEIVTTESIEHLRQKMVRRLYMRFHSTVPDGLESIPGVTRAVVTNNEATLWIQGNINPILQRLTQSNIEHFVFPEAELEDIFLAYYSRRDVRRTPSGGYPRSEEQHHA